MARFRDESVPVAALARQMGGTAPEHWAYGVKQPNIGLIIVLFMLAILPGAIAVAILTKEYLIGLAGDRFVVVQFSGGQVNVKQVLEYRVSELKGKARSSKGSLFTHIRIDDPAKPFIAKFHRLGAKQNKAHAEAIADAIS